MPTETLVSKRKREKKGGREGRETEGEKLEEKRRREIHGDVRYSESQREREREGVGRRASQREGGVGVDTEKRRRGTNTRRGRRLRHTERN